MIMLELGAHQKVTNNARIIRYFDTNGIIDCPHRGQSMGVRSDAAGALYKMVGVPRVSALQNELDAPEHLARAPGIDNFASGYLDFDSKVTLNSGDRIYCYSLCHVVPPFFSWIA
jgi:hypothetical protein